MIGLRLFALLFLMRSRMRGGMSFGRMRSRMRRRMGRRTFDVRWPLLRTRRRHGASYRVTGSWARGRFGMVRLLFMRRGACRFGASHRRRPVSLGRGFAIHLRTSLRALRLLRYVILTSLRPLRLFRRALVRPLIGTQLGAILRRGAGLRPHG